MATGEGESFIRKESSEEATGGIGNITKETISKQLRNMAQLMVVENLHTHLKA